MPEQGEQVVTAPSLFGEALGRAQLSAGDGRQSCAWNVGGKSKGKSKCDGHDPSKGKSKGDDHDPSKGKEKGGKGKSKSNGKEKGGKSKGEGKGKGEGKFDYNELCNKVWWLENGMRHYSNRIEELENRINNAETELARYHELLHS